MHDLEVALEKNQAEKRGMIEDIMRANTFAIDQNSEMVEQIKKAQDMYEEANLQRKEMQE